MPVQDILKRAGVEAPVLTSVQVDADRVVHVISIGAAEPLETAKKFLTVSEDTGYVPLFIADDDYQDYMDSLKSNHKLEAKGGDTKAAKLIAAGEAVDVDEWVAEQDEYEFEDGDFSKERNIWSVIPTADKLVLVPVKRSWQIPAVFCFGDWNECPPAEVHIALLKRWHDKYGAELISMGMDSVYCLVNRPVRTRDAALALAKEQAVYCHDNVDQGAGDGTLSGLAIDLMDAEAWQFWWD